MIILLYLIEERTGNEALLDGLGRESCYSYRACIGRNRAVDVSAFDIALQIVQGKYYI